MNTEEQVIYKAIQVLEEKTGLKGRWYASLKDKGIDGRLELKNGQQKKPFPAIVKKEVKNTFLVNFLQLKEEAPGFIIIAETIYPAIREQLRKMELNYVDTNGNCYIKRNEWVFLVEGFKTEVPITANKDRAFTKTGLLLVFHFLNDEKYLNVTYRQMAEDYNIALGNINNIINSMKDQGYLVRLNKKELKLTRKKELLDEWIPAYEQKLKPTLVVGNFRFLNGFDKDWEKIPLKNTETQWGGEPAANLLTGYLKPAKLTLYTLENKPQLIKKYRLVPDEKGNLVIYKKFWKFNIAADTVPVILVYADLINTGDPRNIETAKKLYNGLLEDQF
ncbi:type IV toxin-antitoxin system AbiEi family antitoxin [Flavobacterium sp. UBA6046]|uniref:type IV toxin-antitoxin system AbiEi family antitoxin n=1 Tax=Flavobacterium sp. UBA6046 TaxID=1946552 RepID=UPI0025BD367F|nr:type IV toxin-antitoxin system AbiEi family antitoxin [Flavobacterium sp. UBA6046]